MLGILTTLFVLSMTPDDARHQRTLEALRSIDTQVARGLVDLIFDEIEWCDLNIGMDNLGWIAPCF